MKNILIPTFLSRDTETAVLTAIGASEPESEILLLIPGESPGDESASAFMRNMRNSLSAQQLEILAICRKHAASAGFQLRVHSQAGISGPLVRNLLANMEIGLVIIPVSFAARQKPLSKNVVAWLAKSRLPILRMSESASTEMKNALLLENASGSAGLVELQQRINRRFPIKIVSQAAVSDHEQSLQKLLRETINSNEIDVLVSTRRTENTRNSKTEHDLHHALGLPVLS
ncbi:MAG: hypothetical protein EOO01_12330, partial [Chitinophagaceae bacterium]